MPPDPSSIQVQRRDAYKWITLGIVGLGTFMTTLDAGIQNVAYPALATAFSVDISLVVWLLLAYLLVSTGLVLTLGWVGDVVGRKRVFALGFLIFGLALALSALSQNILQLIGSRVIQGVGVAMIVANGIALVTAAFPSGERGKALGIIGSVVGIGLACGPVLGGFLLDNLGWQSIFYTRVPIGLLGAGISWLFLREDQTRGKDIAVDWTGALLVFLLMGALLLTINQIGRLGADSPLIWALGSVTLLLAPAFLMVETRASRPLVDFKLLMGRTLSMALLTVIFHFLAWGIIILVSQFFLVQALGFSASYSGILLAVFPAMRILAAPTSGWLSDRLDPRLLSAVGLTVMSLGAVITARLGHQPSGAEIVLAFAVLGLGSGIYESPNTRTIMSSVPPDRLGTAAAALATTRQIGISSGVALAGTIYILRESVHRASAISSGIETSTATIMGAAGAFHDTLIIGAILIFLGVVPSLAQGPSTPLTSRTSQGRQR